MAEFVDNSLQSYLQNRQVLQELHGPGYRLDVRIIVERSDETKFKIRDNAGGIPLSQFTRAFRAAELPSDSTGLSEFGMGMKSAACWFAPRWSVRTKALGESVERTVHFDIAKIVRDDIQELVVVETAAPIDAHYTEIILIDPFDKLISRTSAKVKDHLASIYRLFLRSGEMSLWFVRDGVGDLLEYEIPAILVAPYYRNTGEPPRRWFKEFSFDFGLGMRASGFAALREVASTATAGFALFRRDRLIEGSLDEPYRPPHIFGSGNTYRKQRLIGEIHLDGFDVSHTKDGFKWDEHEQPFLELLRDVLETPEMPMLTQAEGYRARIVSKTLKAEAQRATDHIADTLASEGQQVLEDQSSATPFLEQLPEAVPFDPAAITKLIQVEHRGALWEITIELTVDEAIADWLTISDRAPTASRPRGITVGMSLVHPFVLQYCGADAKNIEALARVAAALGLAEITARDAGVPRYGTIRRNVNQLLRDAFSKP